MVSSISGLNEDHPASDNELIHDVMGACGCTEAEALKLLKVRPF